ncbi:autophagy-related protein 17 [Lipomyces orientalis]|uniref:Autophagy-related protein 17 n=1 Tax=Lipomyces orientalis TaxID=1233043 RepID=A0ACC3TZ41_9ASCO
MEADWFVNAKHALAVAEPICSSASSLVLSARESLESAFAIHSKTLFLSREVHAQIALLYQVNETLHTTAGAFEGEFQGSLVELDRSGDRLDGVLKKLEDTVVDAGFKGTEEGDTKRSLKDHTDDVVVEELKAQLRQAIDYFQDSHRNMISDLSQFDAEISELSSDVSVLAPASSDSSSSKSLVNSLESIEDHAHAMGALLESLAHHYDQCSQALMTSSTSNLHEDQEREDLIIVLRDDAAQVDDVVDEVRQRYADMKTLADSILTFAASSAEHYGATAKLCDDISRHQDSLEKHLFATRQFADDAAEYFSRRNSLLDELDSLVEYFERFMHSYDALVLEVVRRKNTQNRMEKVVRDALDKLKFIYEEEMASRKSFHVKNGDYLPSDLWPGLSEPPIGYEIIAHEISPLPDLSASLIEQVKKRLISAPSLPK